MRKTCLDMIHRLARHDARVVFIGSDLGPGVVDAMRSEMPERCLMEGISEAAVVGLAAGLAMEGHLPYVNTIATFLTRRALEQVALDVCLHRLPVRLIGNGGGLVYAPLGPTHIALDDFALMRALPGMAVVAPCDADEMTRLMEATLVWPGPIYIRLAKGGDRVVSRPDLPFAIGRALPLLMPDMADVLFVTTGVIAQEALAAAERLRGEGIVARVLHCPSVKPLDEAAIRRASAGVRAVIVGEEHSRIGGLGSAVLETLVATAAAGRQPAIRLAALGDAFVSGYGSQRQHWQAAGIDDAGLAALASATLAEQAESA